MDLQAGKPSVLPLRAQAWLFAILPPEPQILADMWFLSHGWIFVREMEGCHILLRVHEHLKSGLRASYEQIVPRSSV